MANYTVRTATLDDTQAIGAVARARVGVWQRMDDAGQVQDIAYDTLTVYERWLHGGPWMSVETGALQLGRLLLGAGIPLVATDDGERVVGYAEVYSGREPAPYGQHLHIGALYTLPDDTDARDALVTAILQHGARMQAERVTANLAANDTATQTFYARHGLRQTDEIQRMTLTAKQGQVFYKAINHLSADPAHIDGWFMHVGRLGSARYQWETLWPPTWNTIPEVRERKTHRLSFTAAGNDAFVFIRQQLYMPRFADVFAWTPKPPTGQLITAIRDWAHREGYRKLVFPVVTSGVKTLGLDAEPDGYREVVLAVDL
jgi:ribosomal protein S18 acetylase RimI-like enzyme